MAQKREREIDSLQHIIETSKAPSLRAIAHSDLAWLIITSDAIAAKKHIDSAYLLHEKLEDKNGIALANYRYGVLYRLSGEYNKAIQFIDKSIVHTESSKDTLKTANGYYQKGVINSMQGNNENSLKELYTTLSLYEAIEYDEGIGFTLNSIGIVYNDLKKYPDAISSYQKAIQIHEKLNDINNLANSYNNLGEIHITQKNYDLALEYFYKTMEINIETDNQWGISINNLNVGSVFINKELYHEALPYLNKAYEIQKKYNYKKEIAGTLSKLGIAYLNLGNYHKSEILLLEGLENAIGSKGATADLHFQLSEVYQKINRPKQSLLHYKKYIVYKDSIFEEEGIKNINTLQIQYETEKKDKEIAENKVELSHNQSILNKKNYQLIYAMIGIGIALLTSFGLWLFFKQRQKLKDIKIQKLQQDQEITKLEALIEGEEKERKRLAQDLHDGINGDLSAIKYQLSSISPENLQKDDQEAFDKAIGMIDHSCQQVRQISHNLSPITIRDFGLITSIEHYCSKVSGLNPLKINFQYFGNEISLPENIETNIYRIVQELINNIIKHAEATKAVVQINHHKENLFITVEDNGKGFDKNISKQGIGLKNIASRIELLNAQLEEDHHDEGTTFNINIDLLKFQIS